MRNINIKEITTSRVISWPSKVSMRILFMVGDGVNVFKNFTSESHDGRRLLYEPVIVMLADPTPDGLAVDDMAGKNRIERAFLTIESRSGSSEEKPKIDAGDSKDSTSASLDRVKSAAAVAAAVTVLLTVDSVLFTAMFATEPCSELCAELSLPDQRPSASQNRALHIALIDHGNHPSHTNATSMNRSQVTRDRKPCIRSCFKNRGVGRLLGMLGS
jgi:hypothetical protein